MKSSRKFCLINLRKILCKLFLCVWHESIAKNNFSMPLNIWKLMENSDTFDAYFRDLQIDMILTIAKGVNWVLSKFVLLIMKTYKISSTSTKHQHNNNIHKHHNSTLNDCQHNFWWKTQHGMKKVRGTSFLLFSSWASFHS